MTLKDWGGLLLDAGKGWANDKAPRMAAALAFYSILSAAPLLVIALGVASMVFDRHEVQEQVVGQLSGLVGEEGGKAIAAMIESAKGPGAGWAMFLGIAMLLFGASGVFAELQDALNTIWGVVPKPGRGFFTVVRDRFLSLAMVFGIAFLLLVTLVVSTVLAALTRFAGLQGAGVVGEIVNFVASFVVVTLLFMMLFRFLPDVKIGWGDVWAGALATALLFTVGKLLIGLYLGNAGLGSSYGSAGSLVVFVVWVFYSAQILYYGAEFTKVYADRFGSRIRPAENAVAATAEARARQGLPPSPAAHGEGRAAG